ncbi:hypothetical protein [Mycetocola zhujimingii]|uniref:hypothetical protein n=1 Tax=Mycetocola zhujimingii TaxID=2079792 RepID=UPI0013C40CD7|nr:hypothetical protein [Mycetocola zhujimingii]
MASSERTSRLAMEPTQSDALLGTISIILAFFIPFVSVFIARGAMRWAKEQGVENRPAYWGFWISVAMLGFMLVVVAGTIVMNLIGHPL